MLRLVLVALIAICDASVFKTSPVAQSIHYVTVLHDHKIGPQPSVTPFNFTITASVLVSEVGELCDNSGDLTGTVAIVRGSEYGRSSKRSSKYAACAERRGASAFIITSDTIHPGWLYRTRNFKGPQHITIPVLEMTESALDDLLEAEPNAALWTVQVIADTSTWPGVFDSLLFFIAFRLVLPLIAAFALFRCLACLMGHILRPPPPSTIGEHMEHWVTTRKLVILVLCIEAMSSSIQLIYCAAGPLMSTGNIPYELLYFLGNMAMALSVFSSLVVIALFVRWGSVTGTTSSSARTEKATVFAGLYIVTWTTMTAVLLDTYVITDAMYIMFTNGVLVMAAMFAFVVYLYTAIRFLQRIRENKLSSTSKWAVGRREKSLRKFLMWIKMSSFANFLLFFPTLLFFSVPGTVDKPEFASGVMFVLFFAGLLQSISQSYGLQPDVYVDEERRGEAEAARQKYEARLETKNRLAALFLPEQELIRKMWGNRNKSGSDTDSGRRNGTEALVKYPVASEASIDVANLVSPEMCVI